MIGGKHVSKYRQGSLVCLKSAWFAALLPACTILLLPVDLDPCRAQEMGRMSSFNKPRLINGQVRFNKRSDADAGVQLLDTIISRVMNIPQVALTKSTSQLALAQNQKQQLNSPTDYKLAIR